MIGVLFATDMEAAPFLIELARLAESTTADDEGATRFLLNGREVAVAVVGMGKCAAKRGTAEFAERYMPRRIVNVGIAGALFDAPVIGKAYRVSSAIDWPHRADRPFVCAADGFEDLPGARLVTSDAPVFCDKIRKAMQPFGDMVDMEGAIIAEICISANIECTQIKCISDFAKDGDHKTLTSNIKIASAAAAALVASRVTIWSVW